MWAPAEDELDFGDLMISLLRKLAKKKGESRTPKA
jgi:hypothetical protein